MQHRAMDHNQAGEEAEEETQVSRVVEVVAAEESGNQSPNLRLASWHAYQQLCNQRVSYQLLCNQRVLRKPTHVYAHATQVYNVTLDVCSASALIKA